MKNQLCFPKQQQQNLVGRVTLFYFYVFAFVSFFFSLQISVMSFLLENKWTLMSALAPNLLWNQHFLEPLEKTSVRL